MPPAPVFDPERDFVAVASSEGRLLVAALAEFPQLSRGKGVKALQIPTARLQAREEYVAALAVFSEGDSIALTCGNRNLTLTPARLKPYQGERGRRGLMLPRGWRQVSRIEVRRARES